MEPHRPYQHAQTVSQQDPILKPALPGWALVWVGLALPALGIPYMIASIVYGALWLNTLRGKGYRSYPATSWMLVAAPLVVGLAILALAALIMGPARLL